MKSVRNKNFLIWSKGLNRQLLDILVDRVESEKERNCKSGRGNYYKLWGLKIEIKR